MTPRAFTLRVGRRGSPAPPWGSYPSGTLNRTLWVSKIPGRFRTRPVPFQPALSGPETADGLNDLVGGEVDLRGGGHAAGGKAQGAPAPLRAQAQGPEHGGDL